MTNREWLRSLNDEELADKFMSDHCNFCADHEYCDGARGCCTDGISQWLKEEHNNKQHIYVN